MSCLKLDTSLWHSYRPFLKPRNYVAKFKNLALELQVVKTGAMIYYEEVADDKCSPYFLTGKWC